MKRWSLTEIQTARKLRLQGLSFSEIRKKVGVPKSTLHTWVRDIPIPPHLRYTTQKEWLKKIQPLAIAALRQKRNAEIEAIINRVKQEVDGWRFLNSKSVQKSLISLLYWAEGQKLPERGAPVKFANTDPRLVLLFVTLLKNCYNIDESKLRIRLHLHWYHNKRKVKEFWKKLLDLEDQQFCKIFLKKRSKTKRFRKNFMGICFVIYQSVDLRQEIVHTAIALQEKMTGVQSNEIVPVA